MMMGISTSATTIGHRRFKCLDILFDVMIIPLFIYCIKLQFYNITKRWEILYN
ncbi:hypothetical protein Scep_024344 [Stephania cephalantha]|uniref:Uncharacterized protein n=1 Tax=Stephania cephalantha TaxID=152367 RepID=A0AAP0F5A7_9MAGN